MKEKIKSQNNKRNSNRSNNNIEIDGIENRNENENENENKNENENGNGNGNGNGNEIMTSSEVSSYNLGSGITNAIVKRAADEYKEVCALMIIIFSSKMIYINIFIFPLVPLFFHLLL